MFFKNTEEVKVSVRSEEVCLSAHAEQRIGMGKDCIVAFGEHKRASDAANTSSPVARASTLKVEGSGL